MEIGFVLDGIWYCVEMGTNGVRVFSIEARLAACFT